MKRTDYLIRAVRRPSVIWDLSVMVLAIIQWWTRVPEFPSDMVVIT